MGIWHASSAVTVSSCLNLASILPALAAAYFWWRSARVPVPQKFVRQGLFFGSGEHDKPPRIDPFTIALTEQSRLSSRGAISAAAAALLQGSSAAISTIGL